jgi:hypothetical protein
MLLQHFHDCAFQASPDQLLADLSVLKKEERGDATDIVPASDTLSSTLSLPTLARPAFSLAMASTAGAIARQGARQGAQKSASTGWSEFSTC